MAGLWHAYRLRWKRRRFLYRIWRKRREIGPVVDRTEAIRPDTILALSTVRNEMLRLPYFLEHYRKLGVGHFLFVDNGSDDGTAEYLADQADVSLWHTAHSYRLSRFGMDWLGWLQWQYGSGNWCLTVDADELLIYPDWQTRDLRALTEWLDAQGLPSFGALMIDLYPKGSTTAVAYQPQDDPTDVLCWFDPGPYRNQIHRYYGNLWVQDGVRDRVFFGKEPARAPTLNKTPLVRWHWRYAYVSSTHQILPARLHDVFDFERDSKPTGALLHTKFLPDVAARAAEEQARGEHFQNSGLYRDYYTALADGPDLWFPGAVRYTGADCLMAQGLMTRGEWG
ncbi:MAG: glycosyltransferase family 2 protein [Pseudomonadota bacterium]